MHATLILKITENIHLDIDWIMALIVFFFLIWLKFDVQLQEMFEKIMQHGDHSTCSCSNCTKRVLTKSQCWSIKNKFYFVKTDLLHFVSMVDHFSRYHHGNSLKFSTHISSLYIYRSLKVYTCIISCYQSISGTCHPNI